MQSVGEVGVEFRAVDAGEVVAHDEALGERFVAGHGEAAAQLGESDEQQAQAVVGVHATTPDRLFAPDTLSLDTLSLES